MSEMEVIRVPAPAWSCCRLERGQACQAFGTVWACSEAWLAIISSVMELGGAGLPVGQSKQAQRGA